MTNEETREPLHQHRLYTPDDFNEDERESRNVIYVAVAELGPSICKVCGAAEADLETWVTCQAYRSVTERLASLQWGTSHDHDR